jgi:hypothetical protein
LPNVGPALAHALEPILHAARQLPPADRLAWLAELRVHAPALVDAIEQLLRADAQPGSALSGGTNG